VFADFSPTPQAFANFSPAPQAFANFSPTPKVFADFSPTPQAFANFSPGLAQPWGNQQTLRSNAESVGERSRARLANAFSVGTFFVFADPGLCQPWAEISERLRR